MAVTLRKRKRGSQSHRGASGHASEEEDLRAHFQQAFEAKFRPLENVDRTPVKASTDDTHFSGTASETSDWSGISEDEDEVEVIAHEVANSTLPDTDRSLQRAYMSSKPPKLHAKKSNGEVKQQNVNAEADDASEAANVKHDLALQRLLKESHLLDPSTFSSPSKATPTGKGRKQALDLRLRDLGAKSSVFAQDKMPIAHRKGIQFKASERESKRRKEAAENGVVLEKARHAVKDMKRRERSVGGPTVRKFRGGTLKLSGRDLRDIQGPKQRRGKVGKNGKRW